MSHGAAIRTRQDRVAALRLPPGRWRRMFGHLGRHDVLLRLGLALLAAIALWGTTVVWGPPLAYRLGDVPQHDILARVAFETKDEVATDKKKYDVQLQTRYVFKHDAKKEENLRASLVTAIGEVASARSADDATWRQFQPPPQIAGDMKLVSLTEFQQATDGLRHPEFKAALKSILAPLAERGMLKDKWRDDLTVLDSPKAQEGRDLATIDILRVDSADAPSLEKVSVTELEVTHYIEELPKELNKNAETARISGHLFYWLRDRLVPTLEFDSQATQVNRQAATVNVPDVMKRYQQRQPLVLAGGGEGITSTRLDLLKKEHAAWLTSPDSRSARISRMLAMLGLILAAYVALGLYLFFRQRELRVNLPHLAALSVLVVATAFAAQWLSHQDLRPEIIPLVVFGLTLAIAFGREMALVATIAVTGIVVLAISRSVAEYFVLLGGTTAAIVLLNNVRGRVKLIQICAAAGVVACLLAITLGVIDGRRFDDRLLIECGRLAFWTLVAGFLVTGLLPFIERLFGVLTDLSLLELSDVSHPLLQELIRRAPGTYNHSINVGSLAEAAAEAIDARGLLVRVGAYFHDIGKMLKPAYYVENQGRNNRHESLAPAMSTLIIIAHIKDGADLARRHHLPQAIIEFIEQHHGTTLVEYFYRRAEKERQLNPDAAVVEEGAFRYPGPKPQTKESAVLMLADNVESASRTLEDPTPARIESLVEEIVMKRLMDDQFDECPINLQELRTVQDSLVKSLIAVYHGRVKYPSQKTA